jgi:hypothetical protein
MSTLRTNNPRTSMAHRILDEIRAGIWHSTRAVNWALAVLGEPINDFA